MKEIIESVLRDRILFIGNEIPLGLSGTRGMSVFLGTPQEIIDELLQVIEKSNGKSL